jgi:hypothetical protein
VTGVETALVCSENEPTTSSEISASPIDNSDPIQFNKRSLSDEDRMKLLKTKWITFGTGLYLLYSRGCRPFHYFALVEPL